MAKVIVVIILALMIGCTNVALAEEPPPAT
jgi:hypothetical protein